MAAKGGPPQTNPVPSYYQLPVTSYQLAVFPVGQKPEARRWPVGEPAKNELISNKAARHSWIPGDPDAVGIEKSPEYKKKKNRSPGWNKGLKTRPAAVLIWGRAETLAVCVDISTPQPTKKKKK